MVRLDKQIEEMTKEELEETIELLELHINSAIEEYRYMEYMEEEKQEHELYEKFGGYGR